MSSSCEDDRFDETYFERGRQAGVSWYENFRWMPERSHAEATAFLLAMGHDGSGPPATVVDYGCAKGFFVRALREKGHRAIGVDVSRYALSRADGCRHALFHTSEAPALAPSALGFCKDVLEHCRGEEELGETLARMAGLARRWLIVVPLADGGRYRIEEYELDATHVIRWDEGGWLGRLVGSPLKLTHWCWRVPGLKDHWRAADPFGNLFIFANGKGEV